MGPKSKNLLRMVRKLWFRNSLGYLENVEGDWELEAQDREQTTFWNARNMQR